MYLLLTFLVSIGEIILLLWGQHNSKKNFAHLALWIEDLMSFNNQWIAVVVIVFHVYKKKKPSISEYPCLLNKEVYFFLNDVIDAIFAMAFYWANKHVLNLLNYCIAKHSRTYDCMFRALVACSVLCASNCNNLLHYVVSLRRYKYS